METRSLLGEIEDMNFAVTQIIYKGIAVNTVIKLLQEKGVADDKIDEILEIINENYQGITRILCGKMK